jgi:hypothetical protein
VNKLTGKTLLAFKVARQAILNNWVFIYLKEPTLLARTLKICKSFDQSGHGVVLFLEDIDQVTRGKRDANMQDILNTLDGGDTKDLNIVSIFTTNHIELIEPTFLRGKRIGSIISLSALDAITARKFIDASFNNNYFVEQKGLDEVCKKIEDSNIVPAFMAEIIEKVKSNMIFEEDNRTVKSEYISDSVESYLRQVGLSAKKDMSENIFEKLGTSLSEVVASGSGLTKMKEDIEFMKTHMEEN